MSCDVTKLEYLNETKQIIRNKLDPNGKIITDETPFRDYAKFIVLSNCCISSAVVNMTPLPTVAIAEIVEV